MPAIAVEEACRGDYEGLDGAFTFFLTLVPITVNIVGEDEEVTVTVTNTFVDPGTTPVPAAAVEGAPRFTG